MIRRGAAAGRMVDLVGVVTVHGRWEREGAWHFDQFWVRVWLQARDGYWILKIILLKCTSLNLDPVSIIHYTRPGSSIKRPTQN